MAEFSEGEAEVEGEEFEGEDAGQAISQLVTVTREPPPESDNSKKKVKGKRKKAPPPIRINLSACKYEVLRIVQRKLGWKEVGDDEDWEIYWTDTSVSIERIMKLTKIQKINHFCGMLEICRKRAMARNLMKMARQFPQHFDFFPRTFILPGDKEEFLADIRARGKKQVYILKPDAGCQGRGIRLVQGGKEEVVNRVLSEMATPNVVAQHYLSAPLLIHGYKFDLRIYALVLSCDPLRVFLFHEGLARICTEKYSPPKASNLDISFMHLTNYAVNKKNEAFVAAVAASGDNGEDASKWCLAQLRAYITSLGHDYSKVWADIGDLIIKSLCSVQPILRNNYRSVLPPDNDGFSCFEILGYDIMLDDQFRPWLIEVNHSPSFNIDSPLDLAIKEELITQTIKLVRVDPKLIAKTKKAERRAATSRLLEPMHVKKPLLGRMGGPPAAAGAAAGAASGGGGGAATAGSAAASGGSASGQAEGKGAAGDGEESGGAAGGALKPRTPEEYEAWRAKVLAARERYEAKHLGSFTRIFPSPDPAKQALYEELLKGANDIFQASFQSRIKRPEEEKKKKEDLETEVQRAERLRAKAHRDNLAQKAVERRKFKMLEAQRALGVPLPGYLAGSQPYLQASGGHQQEQQPTLLPPGHPMYYMLGPYQYDPAVFHQYYQQAYLYGSAGGGGGGGNQRASEVFGERSDVSASSSRPMSALSSSSAAAMSAAAAAAATAAVAADMATCQQQQQQPPIRIYSGPLARGVAAGPPGGQRTGSSTATSGRSSPMGHGGAQQQPPMPHQQMLHQGSLPQHQQQQQQQSGALPLQPFLGAHRRPSSATSSRASGSAGAGCEALDWAEQPAGAAPASGGGGGGSGSGSRGGGGSRTDSPTAALPGAAGAVATGRGSSTVTGANGMAISGSNFSYSHSAAALQQLQDLQQAAATAAAGSGGPGGGNPSAPQPQSTRPVSVGSAHNHVRHAHGSAFEAASAYHAGFSGFQDPGPGEREQQWLGHGNGAGPGAGAGPGRSLVISGSRPPSASSGAPTSLRDKLQPGTGGNGGAPAAAGGAASVGAGSGGSAVGISRKQSFTAALNASSIAAAAAWDAAMAATAAAAGQDPSALMQYLGFRARPESAGHRLRPTSAAGVQRSQSPLAVTGAPAALSGLGPGGAAGSPGISRNGSGRYGSAEMFSLGLTAHAYLQHSQQQQQQPLVVVTGLAGAPTPSSPKASPHQVPPQSPRVYSGASSTAAGGGSGGSGAPLSSPGSGSGSSAPGLAVGPWDSGGTGSGLGLAVGPAAALGGPPGASATAGRAYKQSRATGVAPYPVLSGRNGAQGAGTAATPAPAGSQGLAATSASAPKRRSEGGTEEEEPPTPFMYLPLSIPDVTSERHNTTSICGVGGISARHWSAAASTSAAAAATPTSASLVVGGGGRQRSFTGAGSFVPVVVVTGASAGPSAPGASGGGGGAGGAGGTSSPSAGSLTSRPPVYPPAGGSPGLRGAGAPSSGRTAGGASSTGVLGKVGGGGGAGSGGAGPPGRLATGLTSYAPPLPGATGGTHGGLGGMAGGLVVRGGGAGGGSTSIAALQAGIEGLQITATGLDLDSQLRSAALAALNRKGLTVKGRKVAQQ